MKLIFYLIFLSFVWWQEETGNNANCDKLKRPFENVPEGPLGKLQILKSGRVRLKLYTDNDERPIYFDVNIVPTTFSQVKYVLKIYFKFIFKHDLFTVGVG